jgi:arabinogalactan oligomer/maltooligosaccharide transport system permease protein
MAKTRTMAQKRVMGDIATYIIVGLFIIATIIPIWLVIQQAFYKLDSTLNIGIWPKDATLKNFKLIFTQPDFPMSFKNSLILAITSTLVVIILGTGAAYAFSRFRFPGKNAMLTGFLVYMMLPTTAAMIAQKYILDTVQRWFPNVSVVYPFLILMYIAGSMTFTIWNLKGYFDTVPKSLEEAAIIDGASKFQVFTKIILPLSAPAIAVSALFAFMAPWTDFATPWIFISDANQYTLAMRLNMWISDPTNPLWSEFAAGAIIVALPVAILYLVFQRYIVGGLTAGGVKG